MIGSADASTVSTTSSNWQSLAPHDISDPIDDLIPQLLTTQEQLDWSRYLRTTHFAIGRDHPVFSGAMIFLRTSARNPLLALFDNANLFTVHLGLARHRLTGALYELQPMPSEGNVASPLPTSTHWDDLDSTHCRAAIEAHADDFSNWSLSASTTPLHRLAMASDQPWSQRYATGEQHRAMALCTHAIGIHAAPRPLFHRVHRTLSRRELRLTQFALKAVFDTASSVETSECAWIDVHRFIAAAYVIPLAQTGSGYCADSVANSNEDSKANSDLIGTMNQSALRAAGLPSPIAINWLSEVALSTSATSVTSDTSITSVSQSNREALRRRLQALQAAPVVLPTLLSGLWRVAHKRRLDAEGPNQALTALSRLNEAIDAGAPLYPLLSEFTGLSPRTLRHLRTSTLRASHLAQFDASLDVHFDNSVWASLRQLNDLPEGRWPQNHRTWRCWSDVVGNLSKAATWWRLRLGGIDHGLVSDLRVDVHRGDADADAEADGDGNDASLVAQRRLRERAQAWPRPAFFLRVVQIMAEHGWPQRLPRHPALRVLADYDDPHHPLLPTELMRAALWDVGDFLSAIEQYLGELQGDGDGLKELDEDGAGDDVDVDNLSVAARGPGVAASPSLAAAYAEILNVFRGFDALDFWALSAAWHRESAARGVRLRDALQPNRSDRQTPHLRWAAMLPWNRLLTGRVPGVVLPAGVRLSLTRLRRIFTLRWLTTEDALRLEGTSLEHCFGGYGQSCAMRQRHVLSVTTPHRGEQDQVSLRSTAAFVIERYHGIWQVRLIEHRGFKNGPVPAPHAQAVSELTALLNTPALQARYEALDVLTKRRIKLIRERRMAAQAKLRSESPSTSKSRRRRSQQTAPLAAQEVAALRAALPEPLWTLLQRVVTRRTEITSAKQRNPRRSPR